MHFKKIREIFNKIGIDVDLIDENTDLIESSILDSFGLIALISIIEEDMKISFEAIDYDINNFRTITKLNSLIGKYLL